MNYVTSLKKIRLIRLFAIYDILIALQFPIFYQFETETSKNEKLMKSVIIEDIVVEEPNETTLEGSIKFHNFESNRTRRKNTAEN